MTLLSGINSPQDLKKLSSLELSLLALEIRQFLIENVAKTGGHLAPNLGVVELTIAMHYVFNIPCDSVLWDVGHQSYVHKLLTGRQEAFTSLRKKNGLSGFPDPKESPYDVAYAGHSSTSISLGVGVATGKKLNGEDSATIAIVGDGSFTSGMVYEALNDASWRQLPILIILNDNKMSISENVGGIAKHLGILRSNKTYLSLKKEISGILSRWRWGSWVCNFLYNIKSFVKNIFYKQHNVFDNLGVKYLGPFDGHDIDQLICLFRQVQSLKEPILLHIITEKGRGCKKSEQDPIYFHGIAGQDNVSAVGLSYRGNSWSTIFGNTMCRIAAKEKDLVVITAAMREGTGLVQFSQQYPDQFIDVGIAEAHAVGCAVGLAIKKKKPVVAIYSTFLQRAYDQLIHDVAIGGYPVIFCIDRSGLVPGDGQTHQGVFDISYLRSVPKMVIMSPLIEEELPEMINFSLRLDCPVAIRYPKDFAPQYDILLPNIVLGVGVELHQGDDGVIVIFGSLLTQACALREKFLKSSLHYAVYHLRFAKPISEIVVDYLRTKKNIIVLEEGISSGGIGEYIKSQLFDDEVSILLKNIGDQFPQINSRNGLIEDFGFSAQLVMNEFMMCLSSKGNKSGKYKTTHI